jgi:hypothetical protein
MIISRREFYRRCTLLDFQQISESDEMMSVEMLFKELQMDAPFRNHDYMFDDKIGLSSLLLQEETVGIKNKFPEITTEGERYAKIREELLADTYLPVPVKRDIDYPCVIHIEDGLHRVFIAHSLGMKFIRIHAIYGKFILGKCISFADLPKLLHMLERLFGTEYKTITALRMFLEMVVAKRPDIGETHSISYGNESEQPADKEVEKS